MKHGDRAKTLSRFSMDYIMRYLLYHLTKNEKRRQNANLIVFTMKKLHVIIKKQNKLKQRGVFRCEYQEDRNTEFQIN